jgi:hypothetical protein
VSRLSIPTGKQSGLRTRIVAMAKRYVVRADEKLMAFIEMELAIRICSEFH